MFFSITGLALVLGLAAWGLGFAALLANRKRGIAQLYGLGSLACCAASLCTVVFELARYANIEDIAAFLDTADAFQFCSGTLLLGTLALNGLALLACLRQRNDV